MSYIWNIYFVNLDIIKHSWELGKALMMVVVVMVMMRYY